VDKTAPFLVPWRLDQGKRARDVNPEQPGLFHKRLSSLLSICPNGADIAFACQVAEGGLYYCKQDSPGRPARMTDWFCTHVAHHLGLATAECAVIEDELGNTYFASLHHSSSQDHFACQNFLATAQSDEVGGRSLITDLASLATPLEKSSKKQSLEIDASAQHKFRLN